ncbi:hypothetical protein, partial [Staphylococcus epidermidis]|uniref:hypothetical protein n=1 Tax=Staphylococcus epidermidis TaxID=1282 RepID=UPI0037DA5FC9
MTLKLPHHIHLHPFLNKLLNIPYRPQTLLSHIPHFSFPPPIIHIYPFIATPLTIDLFHTQLHSITHFHLETQPSNDNIN